MLPASIECMIHQRAEFKIIGSSESKFSKSDSQKLSRLSLEAKIILKTVASNDAL